MMFTNWGTFFIICLIILIFSPTHQQQSKMEEKLTVIDFGLSRKLVNIVEGSNRKDNYYIDINVQDPYVSSITLGLEMLDWSGINITPNHFILQKLNRARPNQQNILAIIGQESRFSPLLYQNLNDGRPGQQYMVPEISLSQLCMKYYEKRPNVIVIGPNSNADKVLFGNNWGDIRCHPDIFLISNLQQKPQKTYVQPQKQNYNFLLSTKSYKRSQIQMGDYSMYIRDNVIIQYMSNYQRSNKYLQTQNIVSFDKLLQQINKVFYQQINLSNVQSSPVLLYYVKKSESITQNILRRMNHQKLETMRSQQGSVPLRALPIILINYDREQNYFILNTCNFLINKITVNPKNSTLNISFLNINIDSHGSEKQKLSVFVLNHHSSLQWVPYISVINQVCDKQSQNTSIVKDTDDGRKTGFNDKPIVQTRTQNSSHVVQLESIIFQTIFAVIFLCMFLIVTTIIIVFLCRSLIREEERKEEIRINSRINSTEAQCSSV